MTWQKSGTETTTNSDERAWGLDASSTCGAFERGWGRTEARKDPREHTATREPRVSCSATRATQPSSVNMKPRTLRTSCMGRRMLWRPRCVGNPMCTPPHRPRIHTRLISNCSKGSSRDRHYRENLFNYSRSSVGRYRHVRHAGCVCGLGRPSAVPSQVDARSWGRHFQRRDAKCVMPHHSLHFTSL